LGNGKNGKQYLSQMNTDTHRWGKEKAKQKFATDVPIFL
jgi:hypothetical protein